FGPAQYSAFDSEIFRPYNVTPDALLANFKSLRFTFIPQGDKGVRVFAEPALPGLEIVNQLKLGDGSCPDGNRAFRELIQASFQSHPPRASFAGTYPLSCGERDLNIALHDPQDYVAAMIRQLWGEMGGTWSGSVRDGVVPPGARLLYVHESEPLGDIVRDINKFSNNVMARRRHDEEAPARRARGRQRTYQDRLARRRARHRGICARPQRAAPCRGDDRQPSEGARGRRRDGCAPAVGVRLAYSPSSAHNE